MRGDVVPDAVTVENRRSILVVDDEPHIRRVLEMALSSKGYDVITAPNGIEGLQEIQQDHVDLVILDLMMPVAGGLEILSRIRANPIHSETPVIILTGKGQDADRECALAGGANDFITKPFSPKKLIARIEDILRDA
ncbi:MAG: two-component system response regulator [Gemmatimonadetes bacterium]|nr:two-component system response regulator [Gemmatimonadota bacterium]|tara:strand:- start:41899 stop:42309 length:411 start_codon:yes stop_codon:yes gene_type:complete